VGIYDIGQDAGWSYIVMEYVRGPNLMTLLKASLPPTASEVIGYIAQVAEAMEYAHAQSVIHRDLKPANLLVTMDGSVKVTDFGIARILQGDGDQKTAFSAAGLQVGTVDYMAPEQISGGAIGPATDIYLLGTTLYFCLCRRFPFRGESPLARKLREEAPLLSTRLPSASPELDAALACSLARDPTQRYLSMSAFAQGLKSLPEFHG
jgi:serine/threonine protein kinase